jgi:hypothetical protein
VEPDTPSELIAKPTIVGWGVGAAVGAATGASTPGAYTYALPCPATVDLIVPPATEYTEPVTASGATAPSSAVAVRGSGGGNSMFMVSPLALFGERVAFSLLGAAVLGYQGSLGCLGGRRGDRGTGGCGRRARSGRSDGSGSCGPFRVEVSGKVAGTVGLDSGPGVFNLAIVVSASSRFQLGMVNFHVTRSCNVSVGTRGR